MTGWRAKRSQAVASSEVDVIRSMNDPMTLPDDSRPDLPLAPQNRVPEGRGAKSAVVSRALRRFRAPAGPPEAVLAVCFGAPTRFPRLQQIGQCWRVRRDDPGAAGTASTMTHSASIASPMNSNTNASTAMPPLQYRSTCKGRVELCLRLAGGPSGWWMRG